VSLVRDAEVYLEAWLAHYRGLGCETIALLDNGSRDRTVEIACAHPSVSVFRCGLPFDGWKRAMRRWLIHRFARDRWCLCVDADEFFDWPRSAAVSLADLVHYLEAGGFTAVVAQMLELFPEVLGPPGPEGAFRDHHRFFDLEGIDREPYRVDGNEIADARIETYHGGIRRTLFGFRPWLTKHPLFFCDDRVRPFFDDSHRVEGARVADLTAVLYHYKFAGDFRARVARAVREGNYYRNSLEYRHYAAVLEEDPDLRLARRTSRLLAGPDDLLARGFLVASEAYRGFADGAPARSSEGGPDAFARR
jgi:hypothetical protein